MIPENERAWAAGFFEGEGHIQICGRRSGEGAVHLLIMIGQVDVVPLQWFNARWPGRINRRCYSPELNWRVIYTWRRSARQAARFLADIRPFVVRSLVRERIDLALAFQRQKIIGAKGAAYRSSQVYFFNEMAQLNRRGRRGEEPKLLTSVTDQLEFSLAQQSEPLFTGAMVP